MVSDTHSSRLSEINTIRPTDGIFIRLLYLSRFAYPWQGETNLPSRLLAHAENLLV